MQVEGFSHISRSNVEVKFTTITCTSHSTVFLYMLISFIYKSTDIGIVVVYIIRPAIDNLSMSSSNVEHEEFLNCAE